MVAAFLLDEWIKQNIALLNSMNYILVYNFQVKTITIIRHYRKGILPQKL